MPDKMTNAEWIKKMKSLKCLSGHTAWEAIARLEAADKRITELEGILQNGLPCPELDKIAKALDDFDAEFGEFESQYAYQHGWQNAMDVMKEASK